VSNLYVQRHITLWKDVVIALGQFKELNDPKGDVDGSVEAIWFVL
jgi:hypothetical protein